MSDETPNDQHQPDTADTFTYDVYISYTEADQRWVHDTLLPRLEAEGVRVCLDERDFRLGVPKIAERERAILSSRKTLVIVSPSFLANGWTAFDRLLQQTLDAESLEYRLIPLLKEPCELPPSLRYLTAANFLDPSDPIVEWTRLIATLRVGLPVAVAPAIPVLSIPTPAPLPPGSRMPLSHNPLFVGREEELRELARVLKAGEPVAIGQIAAATGLGGIGKTQLAVEFVHCYGQYFKGGVFWLSFADPAVVPAEIAACGGFDGMRLSRDFSTLPLDEQVQLVLAEWRSSLPRLLVFDNCEDEALLDAWRPKHGSCRVLVTSRRGGWDTALGIHTLPLGVLPRAESIALLRSFRQDLAEDDTDLNTLAAELGDLPLALHLAGSFLKQYQHDMTAAEYLDDLRAVTAIEHKSLEGVGISPTQHDLSVVRTFRISYDRLDVNIPLDALALSILARTAYFALGESIPRNLLRATLELPSDERQAKRRVTQGIQRLVELGFLDEEAEGSVRMHRFVGTFVRTVVPTTVQTTVEHTLLELAEKMNDQGYPAPLLTLQPHLRAITDAALKRQDEQAAGLASALGYHLQMIGVYMEAQYYHAQALAIQQRVLGADHPDTAASLNNLGVAFRTLGQYAKAQHYGEQALVIRRQVLGIDHPDTATSLNNVGVALLAQGRYVEAQHYHEQALEIRQRILGSDHSDIGESFNNLGMALGRQGQYTVAQAYFEQALANWRQALGADHPNTITSLNNLGMVFQVQGQYAESQRYLEETLANWRRVLGPDHPNTITSLNNLGMALQAQGQYAESQRYLRQALDTSQRVLGPDHPITAVSLNNLGKILYTQGQYVEAKRYLEQALDTSQRVLGPDHPDTDRVRQNLARLRDQYHEP